MPAPLLVESLAIPETYPELRRSVESLLVHARHLIDQATVRTYWETGRLITGHLHLREYPPRYGSETIAHLARDLGYSETVLYRCIRFFDCFANLAARPKLLWGHYRALLTIPDAAARATFERAAIAETLTTAALETRLRQWRLQHVALATPTDPSAANSPLLTPQCGTPGLHRVVPREPGLAPGDLATLALDLGFKLYRDLDPDQSRRLSAGDIVRLTDSRITRVDDATKSDLFTYAARLRRVIDGDTLLVALQFAPDHWQDQKLRLRGLDCPELSTPEGQAAKRFVEALAARTRNVILHTTRADKYDRYLADVFLEGDFSGLPFSGQPSSPDSQRSTLSSQLREAPLFLNNLLLTQGHADRKDSLDFSDWEKTLL